MVRIPPLERREEAEPEAQAEWDRQLRAHGRMTSMKRTLARSPLALQALMTWYPLRDEVVSFLGERLTNLFAHAISAESDCLVCSTYFRRVLVEAGENPDALVLDERESAVVELGRQMVRDANRIPDAIHDRVAQGLTPRKMVTLTAFGALMIATNVVNDALGVPLDDYLLPYRKKS